MIFFFAVLRITLITFLFFDSLSPEQVNCSDCLNLRSEMQVRNRPPFLYLREGKECFAAKKHS